MMRSLPLALAAASVACSAWIAVAAGDAPAIAAFSSATPGAAFPAPWSELALPGRKSPQFALVADSGETVLRIRAENAAGTLSHALSADPRATPVLAWRWKIDRVVEKADLARKDGDDFAARLYVFFDMPAATLSLAQRARMKIARIVYGADLPTAAICYVWDNRHPAGATAWNAYSDRVRMVVVRSGAARAGQWVAEARDVEADFRAAFGLAGTQPVPRVTGVAVGSDTDQTGEMVTAWFGDLKLDARR